MITTPFARFAKEFCKESDIASPAAESNAINPVVWMPRVLSTASIKINFKAKPKIEIEKD